MTHNNNDDTFCISSLPQLNNIERAVSAAHTFLQKNPEDPFISKNMNYYKTLFELDEYLIDHEERPYEVSVRSAHNQPPYTSQLALIPVTWHSTRTNENGCPRKTSKRTNST